MLEEIFMYYLAAAAAKSLQSCLTLCNPIDGSPPGSPWDSPGKNTSALPFPSPMHESEKSKWSHSAMSDSSRRHGLQPTRLLRPWDFPGKSTGVGCHCLLWIKSEVSAKQTLEVLASWRVHFQGLSIIYHSNATRNKSHQKKYGL